MGVVLILARFGTDHASPSRGKNFLVWGRIMECILNHCHDGIGGDYLVIGFYVTAVSFLFIMAFLSRSNSIQTAATLIAGSWIFSAAYFFYIGGAGYYLLVILINLLLAFRFLKMSQVQLFPVVLCAIFFMEAGFLTIARTVSFEPYWTIFILNRVFELSLLYIIGCSIHRIRKFRPATEKQPLTHGSNVPFIAH